MENYLNQLIADIRSAGLKLSTPHEIWETGDPDDEIELEDLSFVEEYIYGEKKPISKITGIEAEMLPPEDKLTTEQMGGLAMELEKLLQLKNFALDFPEKLPLHMRYPFIRKFWNENHVEISFGTSHIEFCEYEPVNCPYPEYCQCKDLHDYRIADPDVNDSESDNDDTDTELPF
jgi:hypothetical protein